MTDEAEALRRRSLPERLRYLAYKCEQEPGTVTAIAAASGLRDAADHIDAPPAPVPAGAGALDQETRAFLMHAWRRHIHVSRVPLSKEEVAALFEEELIALPIESGQEDDWFFTDKGLELAKRLFDLPAPPSGGVTEGSLAYDVETRRFEVAELRKGRLGLSAPDRDAILADVEAILERVLTYLASPPAPASGTTEEVERVALAIAQRIDLEHADLEHLHVPTTGIERDDFPDREFAPYLTLARAALAALREDGTP